MDTFRPEDDQSSSGNYSSIRLILPQHEEQYTMKHHAMKVRPLKLHIASALGIAGLLASGGVLAQSQTQSAASGQDQRSAVEMQEIVVTGARTAVPRSAADSLVPIDVITSQDLQSTGSTNVLAALSRLLPSLNFPQPSGADYTQASMPAQLRGMSPDQTLVLVDGKRMHTSAQLNVNGTQGRGSTPVDLNAIPMNAIERIEVLRDGASAQYGSDAIAGVINVILKKGYKHGNLNVTRGIHDGGQGATWQAGVDGGVALGSKGWLHLSANYLNQQFTNHSGPDRRYPGDPTYNTQAFQFGLPWTTSKKGAVNMQYNLGERAQLYGYVIFNDRNVQVPAFFRSWSQFKDLDGASLYPNGFLPIEQYAIQDDSEVLGLKGSLGSWFYDISVNSGGNRWREGMSNTFNPRFGAASPTRFYQGTLLTRQNVVNADFITSADVGWLLNPLSIAWGVEYRQQKFEIKPGEAAVDGAMVATRLQPADSGSHTRHNTSVYAELSTDLTANLSADLAARHESYSDFGNTWSFKGALRYQISNSFALRGSASTGFRAPSLQQQYYATTADNFVTVGGQTVPVEIRTFPAGDPVAEALGMQPLKAERSQNLTFGLVWTAESGLYATLDTYQIKVEDRILLSGNLVGPAVAQYLAGNGFPNAGGGRFFNNAVDTRTRGGDLIVTYPWEFARAGTLKLTVGANYNRTEVLSVKPNPPQLGLAGLVLPIMGRSERGRITEGAPRSKSFVNARWDINHWTLGATVTRYGEFTSFDSTTPSGDQTYGARTVLDTHVSYSVDHWKFTLGANNATNVYPEENAASHNYQGIIRYPGGSPFGFSGVYYYGTVGVNW